MDLDKQTIKCRYAERRCGMTCNNKCIHYPVCEQKNWDFADIDECKYYADRPKGEWHIDESGVRWCKFCGASESSVWKNFCHNCGADMKGGAE